VICLSLGIWREVFGSVFLASELTTNDIYAIKAILGQMLQQKNERERILSERDISLEGHRGYSANSSFR
jgi:serine/threonine protein kinase